MGFVRPSKIQAAALPLIAWHDGKQGKNMIGQAQNGSGKTATFALAVLSAIDYSSLEPQACVVAPTRELARQVEQVIMQLGAHCEVKCVLAIPAQERMPRSP